MQDSTTSALEVPIDAVIFEMPKYGYRPEDLIEEGRFEPGEETHSPEICSTRVELLSALEKMVNESPPPRYRC